MSSRQEQKAQARAEREAAEAAAARSKARRERLQLGLGALVALAAVVVAIVVFSSGGGGGGKKPAGPDDPSDVGATGATAVKLPAVKETDLKKAAAAARCTLADPPNEGRDHVSGKVTYKTNPPSSGNHNQIPAEDGIYDPGNTPEPENYVHSLEHGRIELEYKPGTPPTAVDALKQLASEPLDFGEEGYKDLVFQNNTNMEPQIAAVAWTHIMSCPGYDQGVPDAVRAFRKAYTDKGPEFIP